MGALLFMSGDQFSGAHTASWLAGILHLGFPDLGAGRLETINFMVRKTAHVVGYGVLGGLGRRASQVSRREWSPGRGFAAALILVVGWACMDEIHQAHVPSRTGSPWDVLIDTAGGGMGAGLWWWWRSARNGNPRARGPR